MDNVAIATLGVVMLVLVALVFYLLVNDTRGMSGRIERVLDVRLRTLALLIERFNRGIDNAGGVKRADTELDAIFKALDSVAREVATTRNTVLDLVDADKSRISEVDGFSSSAEPTQLLARMDSMETRLRAGLNDVRKISDETFMIRKTASDIQLIVQALEIRLRSGIASVNNGNPQLEFPQAESGEAEQRSSEPLSEHSRRDFFEQRRARLRKLQS
jgi:hypothetical protein